MKMLILLGRDETIICPASSIETVVENWFLACDRDLDEYDVTMVDCLDGFSIKTDARIDHADKREAFDVGGALTPKTRKAMIRADLMTDEGDYE